MTGLSDLTVLARGGYSTVYRARQDSIGREVALKIDTRSLQSERDRRRFVREAEAAGRMSGHPNVVNIYDAGVTENNHPYLVMELCTGGSYASRLRQQGPLSVLEVRDVGVKIADALQAAHDNGILHRDVKPGNILINRYGVPGLADFGLAALPDPSRELSVTIEALTPAYAPPEVFRMEPPTPLGDQYALGASLYALLSGRPPRWPETGTPSLATMVMMLDEPIPDIPGIPENFSLVLRQAMAPYAEDRYASAAEFRDALAALELDPVTGSRHASFGALPPSSGGPFGGGTVSSGAGAGAGAGSASGPSAAPSGPYGQQSGPPYGQQARPQSAPPSGPQSGPPSGTPSSGGGFGAETGGRPPGAFQASPPQSGPPASLHSGPPGGPPPTTMYPGNTYAPGQRPSSGPPSGFPPTYGPPPGGFHVPPPRGEGLSRQTKRTMVMIIALAAALLVCGVLGSALLAVIGDSAEDQPSSEIETTSAPQSPRAGSPRPAPSRTGDLPGFPLDGLPSSTGDVGTFGSACEVAVLATNGSAIKASCPANPECWRDQSDGTVRARGCTNSHTWETFVIGTLASSTSSLQSDPNVQFLCSQAMLTAVLSATGQDTSGWRVSVSAYGAAKFRCLAGKGTDELNKPYFG